MKTKLEMAHEWYMKHGKDNVMEKSIACAWQYADAMQAEADKREDKKQAERIKIYADAFMNCEIQVIDEDGDCRITTRQKELDRDKWQPDWSQAPEWANWWVIGSLTKQGIWSATKPNSAKINGVDYWEVTSPSGDEHLSVAPSFNYQGDWRDSLRKRP
nr:MAG TPA: hypothetical protein [Caudoviricetes sp.]